MNGSNSQSASFLQSQSQQQIQTQALDHNYTHFEALCDTLYGPDPRAQSRAPPASTQDR